MIGKPNVDGAARGAGQGVKNEAESGTTAIGRSLVLETNQTSTSNSTCQDKLEKRARFLVAERPNPSVTELASLPLCQYRRTLSVLIPLGNKLSLQANPSRLILFELSSGSRFAKFPSRKQLGTDGTPMLRWSAGFLAIAILAGVLGFGNIAAEAAEIAKIFFYLFLIISVLAFLIAVVMERKLSGE